MAEGNGNETAVFTTKHVHSCPEQKPAPLSRTWTEADQQLWGRRVKIRKMRIVKTAHQIVLPLDEYRGTTSFVPHSFLDTQPHL